MNDYVLLMLARYYQEDRQREQRKVSQQPNRQLHKRLMRLLTLFL